MGDWVLARNERAELATATTNRGAANSKGGYVQLTAATGFAYSAVTLNLFGGGGGGQCFLIDIAMGDALVEQLIVQNVLLDTIRGALQNQVGITLPIQIPEGVRLAARCQEIGGAGTRTVEVALTGRAGGSNYPPATGPIITYGADASSSNGTVLDAGAVINTYGGWTEIAAATTSHHTGLLAVLGTNQQTTGLPAGVAGFQIGIGASGSETIIAEHLSCTNATQNRIMQSSFDTAVSVPAGTRLSMRYRCASATAPSRTSTAIILGY